MELDRRSAVTQPYRAGATRKGRTPVGKEKPFSISKQEVWEAYQRVKAKLGARPRCQKLLREDRSQALDASGEPAYGMCMGAALHRALAQGARADAGGHAGEAGSGFAPGGRY
jgi:hypothetical protein